MQPDSIKILITGANGNLGRQLIRHLCDKQVGMGTDQPVVRALVRSQRAAEVIRALACENQPEVMVGDYTDPSFMRAAVTDCHAVIHLVGIIKETSTTRYSHAHEDTCQVLANILEGSAIKRIVYLSILGSRPDSENACLASKGRAGTLLGQCPCPSTILRVPMVLGPDDYASASLRKQAQSRIVSLVGGGKTLQQPVDSHDVISAILAAVRTSHSEDSEFDLAGPERLTHRDLVQRAGQLHGRKPWILPIPTPLARLFIALVENIGKNPPITRSMFEILQYDDLVDQVPCCSELGIALTSLDETLQHYVGPEE
jgi:NADH dehydrogenase